jgi:hypothetical protein
MQENQRVADMADEVLARQAGSRAERTGEAFEVALIAVLETEAGRQLGELRDGPHRGELAQRWQENLPRERAEERSRARREELAWQREQERERQRVQARLDALWERFMREELRELEERKAGQLADLLGEALPGEPPAALRRLADEDRRQAQAGLVALMSMGKVSYKRVDELSPADMPARAAANRLRTTWLKERRDGWLARGPGGRV